MRTTRSTLRTTLAAAALLPLLAGTVSTAATAATPTAATEAAPTTVQAQAAGEWQDGKHDEDQVIDFVTGRPGTGISANVGWRGNGDRVPQVGETFYVRAYAGLVSLPASGKAAVLPEFLLPAGLEYADDTAPVRWSFTPSGQSTVLREDQLTYDRGTNGGVLFGTPDGQPWTVRQGDVLEIQVPVRATRELKGPATQQPECQDRRDGRAPCPVAQSGDHLQVAFTVGGHGGTKSYVTPYVGLFASKPGSGNPGNPGNPAPAVRAASSTGAGFVVSRTKRGRAVVTVRSSRTPTGRVVVLDRGRQVGAATLTAGHAGRTSIALPKLRRGKHVLVVRYAGSGTVKPSQSAPRRVTVR
ncbi:Ig-like domain-containing protein [Nocardioides litoris]|uniref:Ig-like domain-containing protein n=1 Tax=Nocardioides litoris TaxID=1926648 RepID=UPI0011201ABB|nr:Ig-like domain-containing protein [Nocardioides litoris]